MNNAMSNTAQPPKQHWSISNPYYTIESVRNNPGNFHLVVENDAHRTALIDYFTNALETNKYRVKTSGASPIVFRTDFNEESAPFYSVEEVVERAANILGKKLATHHTLAEALGVGAAASRS